MAQNKQKKVDKKSNNISGRNIYLDRQGQTVYYDPVSKCGYIIDKKVEGKFFVYKNRFVLILMIMILFSEYFPSWKEVVITGIAIYLLAEILFRFKFLRSLRQTTKFNREKRQTMLKSIIESKDTKKAILRIILYLAFAILVILNAITMKADIAILLVSILLSIMAMYCVIVNIIACIKMK